MQKVVLGFNRARLSATQ